MTPQPLITLGDLLRRHERWDEAIVFYTQAIKRVGILTRRHWRMLYSRGIVLERAKRWPEAENDFLRALEFEPDQPYVLNYLGYSWVDQGVHLKRALDMIHNAVRRRPNDGYIIDSLGWVYFRLGNYKKAVLELSAPSRSGLRTRLSMIIWATPIGGSVGNWKPAFNGNVRSALSRTPSSMSMSARS